MTEHDGVPESPTPTDEKDLASLEQITNEAVIIPKEVDANDLTVDFAMAGETGEMKKPPMFEFIDEPRKKDPLAKLSIFDELERGIHWTAQAHAEVWTTLHRAMYELRMRDKALFNLQNQNRELLGQPPLDAPEKPLFSPPEKPEHLIVIGERALQRWVRALFVSVVVLFSALFIAWAFFLMRGFES